MTGNKHSSQSISHGNVPHNQLHAAHATPASRNIQLTAAPRKNPDIEKLARALINIAEALVKGHDKQQGQKGTVENEHEQNAE